MINVTLNNDGSLTFSGAASLTITQTSLGLTVSSNDTFSLPADPTLLAKLNVIREDVAKLVGDVA